jgi:proteasome activator subunit 4
MRIIYFRQLFLLSARNRKMLFDCVTSMLENTQPEIRAGAFVTLSGIIGCSPLALRGEAVLQLRDRFTKMLTGYPLPKKPNGPISGLSSARSAGINIPTPKHTRLVITRHAAVIGLGALVQAFTLHESATGVDAGGVTHVK